jgi:membrane protein YdbS with pleckstrin-like domain
MTFVAGYMVVYTVTHGGELWKIITQGIVLVLGIIFCIMIYSAGKKDN